MPSSVHERPVRPRSLHVHPAAIRAAPVVCRRPHRRERVRAQPRRSHDAQCHLGGRPGRRPGAQAAHPFGPRRIERLVRAGRIAPVHIRTAGPGPVAGRQARHRTHGPLVAATSWWRSATPGGSRRWRGKLRDRPVRRRGGPARPGASGHRGPGGGRREGDDAHQGRCVGAAVRGLSHPLLGPLPGPSRGCICSCWPSTM